MEIDKKIIKKLIETLDDLKKSLKGEDVINSDQPSSTTDAWLVYDSAREPHNEDNDADLVLYPNNDPGDTEAGNIDLLSNGVKIRINAAAMNEAHTYIYMAFAETPFKYANAR